MKSYDFLTEVQFTFNHVVIHHTCSIDVKVASVNESPSKLVHVTNTHALRAVPSLCSDSFASQPGHFTQLKLYCHDGLIDNTENVAEQFVTKTALLGPSFDLMT